MISANLSAIFYLISGVLFILALRGLSSPETSRQGNFFGITGMVIAITVTFLSLGNFSSGFIFVLIFLLAGGLIGAIIALAHDILITLGVFSILDFEISLAIIAAFLTIVGYSLNDTIVIFDRIRENTKGARNIPLGLVVNQSINESLSRTIITSLTTFVVVFILFLVGGEVIHSFAFAMIIGVLVGTYSSIFIASPIVIAMDKNRS